MIGEKEKLRFNPTDAKLGNWFMRNYEALLEADMDGFVLSKSEKVHNWKEFIKHIKNSISSGKYFVGSHMVFRHIKVIKESKGELS